MRLTPSLLSYFWQIHFRHSVDYVDLPPSPRIFDKNHELLGFETCILYYPHYFLRVRGTDRITQSPFWARLSNKSYKIECFYFWQYVLWPPPFPTFVISFDLPPSYLDKAFKYTAFFMLPLTWIVQLSMINKIFSTLTELILIKLICSTKFIWTTWS